MAVASISPASLPVSICAVWDSKFSLFSSYFYALPGPIIYMILLTGFSMIGETGIKYIEYASAGILVFVLLVIFKFIKKNYIHSLEIGIKKQHIIILCASFLLYSGNTARRFITRIFALNANDLPGTVFAIQMFDLIFILFFIVCFIGISKSKIKFVLALLISGVYALSRGRIEILSSWSIYILAVMLVMAVSSIIYDIANKKDKTKKMEIKFDYKPLRNLLFFLMVGSVFAATAFLLSGRDANAWFLAFRGVVSSLTSFGGGEIYNAIALETFVETGFISEDFYMSRILGITGAMPGPIICSILAGVGFAYGSSAGSVALGWVFGLLGCSMAITATAIGALTLFSIFGYLKESPRLKMIVMCIIPLVCGVLISVSLTLLLRASEVIASIGIHPLIGLGTAVIMFFLMLFANLRLKINDILLFIIGGLLTLVGLGLLSNFIF